MAHDITGIHKERGNLTGEFDAAEFRAMADLFMKLCKPGIVGYGTTATTTAKSTFAGTILTGGAFESGHCLVTGGAVIDEWYTDKIDFALAGAGGAALAAGTYNVYLRLKNCGTDGNRYFKAYPMVTDESEIYGVDYDGDADAFRVGTVDEDVYLVIRSGVVWDGAAFTDQGVDERAGKFGVIDLTAMGRGPILNVLMGNDDRYIEIDGLMVDELVVDDIKINDNGEIHFGNYARIYAPQNFKFESWGFTEWIFMNGGAFMDFGQNSRLDFGADSYVRMLNDSHLEILGTATLSVAGNFEKLVGSSMNLNDQEYTATPSPKGLYGAQQARCIAVVNHDGTLLWGFNVDSVVHVVGSGSYQINMKAQMDSTDYGLIPGLNMNQPSCTIDAVPAGALTFYVHTTQGGGASDLSFTVNVYGDKLQET